MSGRYAGSAPLTYTPPDGPAIAYLEPRMIPPGAAVASGATAAVQAGEVNRLDLVAYRTLGNAGLAWRIADANDAMDPFELCRRPGHVLELPGSSP